ncbi:Axial budding pattern protein 2 [Hypsizygus marmoreus]|uniref:Axial budding pattern protein 2 n=1 Tax=Hypsizygus marmoreus TaxID=39966 RepID=A0A369JVF0_HYPMA|nr:Axial budding pattern protein 2 [Hypsizygus marmoreus]
MLVLLLNFLALALTVSSSQLTFPLDEQLPLIARVDKFYSWTFSPKTCNSSNGPLIYSAPSLPQWLSFNHDNVTFSGTPSTKDEGFSKITVTCKDSSSTVSSAFNLFVSGQPEPTLHKPISDQFKLPSPSMSSVFALSPNSGLVTPTATVPALRIPPKWSFSIGFESDTYLSADDRKLLYGLQAGDGGPPPEWMLFNPTAMTVNGVTPIEGSISQQAVFHLSLVVSDEEGYSASTLPFDLFIASHELSMTTSSLPIINITESTPFSVTLSSPADFSGVLVDGEAIQPSDIMTLVVDTSQYGSWLKYDHGSRTLSGDPGNNTFVAGKNPPLLVTLTTTFNQSIQTITSLESVPSYFSSSSFPPIQAVQGDPLEFNLVQDYSNATGHDDATMTAAFEPPEATDWLKFDSTAGKLEGTIPSDFAGTHITVTFTAYSHITHSTSHASLPILLSSPDHTKKGYGAHPVGLSAAAHAKLVLGLGIAFGVVGGLCVIGGILATFRHCARVEDTAVGGEEGKDVWSEQDKRWYGVGLSKSRGYGWDERDPNFTEKPTRSSMNIRAAYNARRADQYENLGLGLRRVSERSQSAEAGSQRSNSQSPGVMSKREFITRLKETVRVVSDKVNRRPSRTRPTIGKPILSSSHKPPGLPIHRDVHTVSDSPSNPFDVPALPSHPGSTIMTNSPSASTGEHSIPRRRADFGPPRPPAQVHFEDGRLSRQLSTGSANSATSNASAMTHAAEAVVQTASKAMSFRSGSGLSVQSYVMETPAAPGARPRLVPFTSASRVPVPQRPPSPLGPRKENSPSKRVASQTAKVWRRESSSPDAMGDLPQSTSGDELKMGLHYMQSLGSEQKVDLPPPRDAAATSEAGLKTLVRSGERFRFRVPIPSSTRSRKLEVKLVSGRPLPKFLHVDMSGVKINGAIELYGAPAFGDIAELTVGVYDDDGVCVKKVVIEVVKWH